MKKSDLLLLPTPENLRHYAERLRVWCLSYDYAPSMANDLGQSVLPKAADEIERLSAALEQHEAQRERPTMEHCSFSTGIDGSITAGRGVLDANGYWEYPCDECAARAQWRADAVQFMDAADSGDSDLTTSAMLRYSAQLAEENQRLKGMTVCPSPSDCCGHGRRPPVNLYRVTLRGMNHAVSGAIWGVAYVVATDPTRAYDMVRDSLDSRDIGLPTNRALSSIELLASESLWPEGHRLYLPEALFDGGAK